MMNRCLMSGFSEVFRWLSKSNLLTAMLLIWPSFAEVARNRDWNDSVGWLDASDERRGSKSDVRPELDKLGFQEDEIELLESLYRKKELFNLKSYPKVRKIFADRFARQHQPDLEAAWDSEYPQLLEWMNTHSDLKEEFYTAISPSDDQIQSALQVFQALKQKYPDQMAQYGNLAIAVAVTWDRRDNVFQVTHLAQQCKAVPIGSPVGPLENFAFIVDNPKVMQGRGEWLPWEFLCHIVNHETPLQEREWALQRFLPVRAMFGKCYSDVPYDMPMLESQGQVTKMDGHEYTLPNLLALGGVCAQQADFAARVGKSLAVPAAYVSGESANQGRHAWVMWVEVKNVNKSSIVFSLESHGRYNYDKYYVGKLKDPQSGKEITDRQLELRLHNIGTNPIAKRHVDRLVELFPYFAEKHQLTLREKFDYWQQLQRLCVGHEAVWREMSKMAGNPEVKKTQKNELKKLVNDLFRTFSNYPDFTWEIFDSLVYSEESPAERSKLYERLVLMYTKVERPDLACEARLKVAQLQVVDGKKIEAVQGLSETIYAFPDEGRYVPKMLDQVELICNEIEDSDVHLLAFYDRFLPRIPPFRGTAPNKFCVSMYERAITLFRKHNLTDAANRYEGALQTILKGKPR
ncbi:MAG: hypothetical protein JNL67_19170 [Planctomycetaceae bacterium]|nr:hypothetical protein [Planctomycetaceae bacterium]